MGYERDFVIHGQNLRNAIGCDFERRQRIGDDIKIYRGPIKRVGLTSNPLYRDLNRTDGALAQQFTVICDWLAESLEGEWHLLPNYSGGLIDEDNATVAYASYYPETKPFVDDKGRLAFKHPIPLSDYHESYTVLPEGDNIEKPQK